GVLGIRATLRHWLHPRPAAGGLRQQMKIGITGGSGGVGSAIIEMALKRGDTLVSVDRVPPQKPTGGVTQITADVVDYDALIAAFAGCDAVVHMAAIPSPFRHPDHEVHNNNVVGSYNVLRAAA